MKVLPCPPKGLEILPMAPRRSLEIPSFDSWGRFIGPPADGGCAPTHGNSSLLRRCSWEETKRIHPVEDHSTDGRVRHDS